jgi:small subunit ribosomal protein S6
VSQRYEVLFIVRPDIGEAGVQEQVVRARRALEEHGATAIQVHDWGIRDLAYRIETHRRGWYILIEHEGDARAVNELERQLKLSDQILRYMSVKQSESAATILGADHARTEATSAPAAPNTAAAAGPRAETEAAPGAAAETGAGSEDVTGQGTAEPPPPDPEPQPPAEEKGDR